MSPDEIRNLIIEVVREEIASHVHGVNAPRVNGKSLQSAPQLALTSANSTAFSTIGITKLDSDNIPILNNMRTRISNIENRLQNLNLLK